MTNSTFKVSFFIPAILSVTFLFAFALVAVPAAPASASASDVNVWWPSSGARVSGSQPFKAMVPGLDASTYEMFWEVDGGTWNWMDTNTADYPHKEAQVDVSGWNWHGAGPYVVTFIARQNGTIIGEQSETIYIDNGQAVAAAPAPQSSQSVSQQPAPQQPVQAAPSVSAPAPLQATLPAPTITSAPAQSQAQSPAPSAAMPDSSSLYVNPDSEAAKQASAWASSDPSAAAAMRVLAGNPTAAWFGNWNSNVGSDVHALVAAAQARSQVPVLVAYDIPQRDCGGYSAGGSNNPSGYKAWISSFASGIGSAKAIVILEPDALAQISCLSGSDQATRLDLLASAVKTLKANPNTSVYIDAGHSNWIDASTMAAELKKADIADADGFSLNVSNFDATPDEIAYGTQVSAKAGGAHFVIDTSRNGNGSNGEFCNPSGRAIGIAPTAKTGNPLVDAFLWIKTPGESDGSCNGGLSAGTWWPQYALGLVRNAR